MAEKSAEIGDGPSKQPTRPTLLKMVLEALTSNKTSKGLTLQAIKRYVTETYPETKENFSNLRLRNAMKKGLESGEIIRPKTSESNGMVGHFLINRTYIAQKDQEKKKSVKKVAKEGKTTSSPSKKKPAKSPIKAKMGKSPVKSKSKPSAKVATKTTKPKSADTKAKTTTKKTTSGGAAKSKSPSAKATSTKTKKPAASKKTKAGKSPKK